jgi:5-methyltetrahydropteroyltriglutamate--homocysteine methyltransferase
VESALRLYAPEQIFLNPDCGFGTFSSRPMNSFAVARAKLEAIVAAAHELRGQSRATFDPMHTATDEVGPKPKGR